MDLNHLFYFVDSFCVFFDRHFSPNTRRSPGPSSLYPSEIITLLLLHQQQQYKNFKAFYTNHAQPFLRKDFPRLPSYSRFVELIPRAAPYLYVLTQYLSGSCTGKSFLDSSLLRVCQPVRAPRHKVFDGMAAWSKNTKGWCFGLKLHLVINDSRVILCFALSSANVDDRKPVRQLLRGLFGKVYADKGYLSKKLFEDLLRQGITLVTRNRKGMKKEMLEREDARGLRERCKVETTLSVLKNRYEIEHTRHRSPQNALVHIMTALLSYNLFSGHTALASELPDFQLLLTRAA